MSERTASAQSDFDFWLGHWTVTLTDTGEVIGHNDIELRHDGRVLAEHYTTLNGRFSGSSLNGFDATTGRWHQCWMDNGGLVLDLYGGRVGESMVMTGESTPGTTQRITWNPRDDGSVRQHWEQSADDGSTWDTVFDGLYVRL